MSNAFRLAASNSEIDSLQIAANLAALSQVRRNDEKWAVMR